MSYITNKNHNNEIIKNYGEMFIQRMQQGSEILLLTFMFEPLPNHLKARKQIMHEEIGKTYAKQLTRHVRRPDRSSIFHFPMWLGCPDWPIYKQNKVSKSDVQINNGLHIHILTAIPPTTRMQTSFVDHIKSNQNLYAGPNSKIDRIDALEITNTPEHVADYVLKSIKSGKSDLDDIILFPRSHSEM